VCNPEKPRTRSFSTVTIKQLADKWPLRQSYREPNPIHSNNGEANNRLAQQAHLHLAFVLEGGIALKRIQIPLRSAGYDQMTHCFHYKRISLSGNTSRDKVRNVQTTNS
jgi:hypothetical protein